MCYRNRYLYVRSFLFLLLTSMNHWQSVLGSDDLESVDEIDSEVSYMSQCIWVYRMVNMKMLLKAIEKLKGSITLYTDVSVKLLEFSLYIQISASFVSGWPNESVRSRPKQKETKTQEITFPNSQAWQEEEVSIYWRELFPLWIVYRSNQVFELQDCISLFNF